MYIAGTSPGSSWCSQALPLQHEDCLWLQSYVCQQVCHRLCGCMHMHPVELECCILARHLQGLPNAEVGEHAE